MFSLLGRDRFVADLSLYSTGLFPLLGYASTRVQPRVLDVFERWFLPLTTSLIPALPGMITALLPGAFFFKKCFVIVSIPQFFFFFQIDFEKIGIEETHSELFPRVLRILNRLREVTDRKLFVVEMWRCLLTCPGVRLSSVHYLIEVMGRGTSTEEEEDDDEEDEDGSEDETVEEGMEHDEKIAERRKILKENGSSEAHVEKVKEFLPEEPAVALFFSHSNKNAFVCSFGKKSRGRVANKSELMLAIIDPFGFVVQSRILVFFYSHIVWNDIPPANLFQNCLDVQLDQKHSPFASILP
jgi:hypothetical protein